MTTVFDRPHALKDVPLHYCPGCTHGIIHRLVAQAIDELGIEGRSVGIASVGCSVLTYNYFNVDMIQAAHGRAPAVATGVKRAYPDNIVFTYQGDGDLAAIGTAETVHSAARGENITVIFVNNAIYGMTGGQMAPTSLPGQVTQTSPYGRDVKTVGYPVRVCELLPRHQEGLPVSDGGQGLQPHRDPVHLPHQLGLHPGQGAGMAGAEHDPLLSPGGLQGQIRGKGGGVR